MTRLALIFTALLGAVAAMVAAPGSAHAFCGFYVGGADTKLYNDATQVVLMRGGTRTVLSMQNNYQGPAEDFAMVVPVPTVLQKDDVKTLPKSVFDRVDALSSPRLVEYWEQDPCYQPRPEYSRRAMKSAGAPMAARAEDEAPRDYGVRIEAQFEVGEYDIVILSANDSLGLYDWLKDNGYKIPDGAAEVLRPYISDGMKFFVAKVNIAKVQYDASGNTMLSPLRFHYDTEVFSLPVRLGLLNSKGTQDLIVYILARDQRYEVANYKNVTIPTNIRVRDRTRDHFASFYASLFDATMKQNRGAVVTEYAWQATNCDPCPGPSAALQASELAILGADVLDGSGATMAVPPGRPGGARRRPVWNGGGSNFVLTRLHTRYSKASLGRDLVFREAAPIVGGREMYNGRRLEKTAQSSSFNNFQARYIIRHKWAGPIACKNPRRGIWGGPPHGQATPSVATKLGLTRKRNVRVSRYVLQNVPEIGLRRSTKKATEQKAPGDKSPK